METSQNGIKLIKYFEGIHDGDLRKIGLQPKMCPAGIWTVGYGYALVNKKTGKWLKGEADYKLIATQYPEYLNMTEQEAEKLLAEVLKKYEKIVNSKLKRTIFQSQYDMLVSHTYNTGGSDKLFKLINENAPISKIKEWVENHYIQGGGKVLPGLVKRRKTEFNLYYTGKLKLL